MIQYTAIYKTPEGIVEKQYVIDSSWVIGTYIKNEMQKYIAKYPPKSRHLDDVTLISLFISNDSL